MNILRTLSFILGCLAIFAAGPATAAKYKVTAVTDGGSISGRITLNGAAPARSALPLSGDRGCSLVSASRSASSAPGVWYISTAAIASSSLSYGSARSSSSMTVPATLLEMSRRSFSARIR